MARGPRPRQPRPAGAGTSRSAQTRSQADADAQTQAETRTGTQPQPQPETQIPAETQIRAGARAQDRRRGDTGPAVPREPAGARGGSTRVRVNSQDKVSALDPERESRYEPVPTGGGRFSDWRRSLQLGSSRPAGRGRDRADESARAPGRRLSPRARRLLALLAVLAAVVLLLWAVFASPLFAVRSIQLEGASLVDEAEVQQRLESLQGTPMTRISHDDVMAPLADLPQIRDAEASAGTDGALEVQLIERVPVAAVEGDDGWVLVDGEGTPLQAGQPREQIRVPMIDGGMEVLGEPGFQIVGGVLATLPASLLEQVGTARAEAGGAVMLELDDGLSVRWGDDSDSALKSEVLSSLVGAAEQTGPVEVYDVSAPQHPVLE